MASCGDGGLHSTLPAAPPGPVSGANRTGHAGSVPGVERITELIPGWLAWPSSVLSTLAALAGSGFMLHAAAFGSVWSVVWAAVAFGVAAALWFLADIATSGRRW